jgi:transcriptional regulator with XRE-family HTH domain
MQTKNNILEKKLINKDVCVRIKQIRIDNNLTQVEFSQKLNYSQEKISRIEKNFLNVDFELLYKIYNIFKVELCWLFTGVGNIYINQVFNNNDIKIKLKYHLEEINKIINNI